MTEPVPPGEPVASGSGAPEPPPPGAVVPPTALAPVRSPLSDGQWHRLHPLTPVLRGGLFLIVVTGIVITNLRDRLVVWLFPGLAEWQEYEGGDPVDYIWANNLWLIAGLVVLGILLVILVVFWMSWRFHTFRITGDDVEVRSGVFFRTHRRAPLDRVQGVNLTRPMVARLLGAAKLEVVGAGLDANVKLEYLSTANAEAVRADILRLASGRQLAEAREAQARGIPLSQATKDAVAAGISGLIDGVDGPESEPESVVHIPAGRLIGAHLLSGSTIWLIVLLAAVIVGAIFGTPWVLFTIVPTVIAFGAYWFRSITRSLRYSIAPTSSGVRITFGLFTTITETLPPGRVHAFEIRQPILWRGAGWWSMRVNRMSGRSATDSQSLQFAEVLPVGTRADVERVLRLFLPVLSEGEAELIVRSGMFAETAGTTDDPFETTPRRARWLRPLSWRRNGVLVTDDALLLRHGFLQRALVILPLARLQSVRISQGPVDRALKVANLTGHTVLGPVTAKVGIIDRDTALDAWSTTETRTISAAARDRSHRWDEATVDASAVGGPAVDASAAGSSETNAPAQRGAVEGGPRETISTSDASAEDVSAEDVS